MKRLLLLIAGIVLAIALIAWWRSGRAPQYVNLPPAASGDWIAFGDSLTQGYGSTEGKDYPAQLVRKLGVKIQNHGVNGETTGDALNRMETVVQTKPRVVLLCLGGNDALQQIPRERTFANLGKIIDRFHAAGSFVVLIGVRSATLRDKNEEFFEKLAEEKRVFLVPDILSGVVFKPTLMSDAVHPNDAGYTAIAERLEAELKPLLPQLQ